MISPGDEFLPNGNPAPFIARWDTLVNALIVEPSVKLVARTAAGYGIYDGTGIYPGNERLARQTSLSTECIRSAWKVLRAADMAVRDCRSQWNGDYRTADMYTLEIPGDWRNLPVLGPSFGKFTCQQCGKVFNPQPGTVLRPDGTVGFRLPRMVFCPAPRTPRLRPNGTRPKRPASCFALWQKERRGKGDVSWEMFSQARHDDWAATSATAPKPEEEAADAFA